MYRYIILIFSFFISFQTVFAQKPNGRLYVLNEGTFGGKGTVGYIEYPCAAYTHIDSLTPYGVSLLVSENLLFVVEGSGAIRTYDINNNHSLVNVISDAWARKLARYENQLLVTTNKAPFFRAYDLSTSGYPLLYALDTTQIYNETEGVYVVDSLAFVAENGFNGFGQHGVTDTTVAVVNLKTKSLVKNIYVAPNPGEIVRAADGNLYVQSINYTPGASGLTVTRINPASQAVEFVSITSVGSQGGFSCNGYYIYFIQSDLQTFQNTGVGTIDVANFGIQTNFLAGNYYGLLTSPHLGELFVSETDFFSYGKVGYFENGQINGLTETYISPRAFAFEPNPLPYPFLGPDVTVCSQPTYTLSLSPIYTNLVWDDGSTNNARTVTQSGVYWVEATFENGCKGRDSIRVTMDAPPSGPILASDPQNETNIATEGPFQIWALTLSDETSPYQVKLKFGGAPDNVTESMWVLTPDATPDTLSNVLETIANFETIGIKTIKFYYTSVNNCAGYAELNLRIEKVMSRQTVISEEKLFSLYPNPVASGESLTLRFREGMQFRSATIYDVLGKSKEIDVFNGEKLNLPPLVSGAYLLKLETESGVYFEKLWIK